MNRPKTTLFMLSSVDGKISTGSSDKLDFDKDIPGMNGVKDGLHQYYDIQQTTDLWSLNSGRTLAKIGVNTNKDKPKKTAVNYVIIDNHHLNLNGIRYMADKASKLIVITSNKRHPAFFADRGEVYTIYQDKINIRDAFETLYKCFKCKEITIETGGTINGMLLREHIIDYVHIILAPMLVGGRDTSSLIDGISITREDQLKHIGTLELIEMKQLKNSYIQLIYKVINSIE